MKIIDLTGTLSGRENACLFVMSVDPIWSEYLEKFNIVRDRTVVFVTVVHDGLELGPVWLPDWPTPCRLCVKLHSLPNKLTAEHLEQALTSRTSVSKIDDVDLTKISVLAEERLMQPELDCCITTYSGTFNEHNTTRYLAHPLCPACMGSCSKRVGRFAPYDIPNILALSPSKISNSIYGVVLHAPITNLWLQSENEHVFAQKPSIEEAYKTLLGEAVERLAVRWPLESDYVASVDDLPYPAFGVETFPDGAKRLQALDIGWRTGRDLSTGAHVLAPIASLVAPPGTAKNDVEIFFSNAGIGAHTTAINARRHAVLEAVEREYVAAFWDGDLPGKVIDDGDQNTLTIAMIPWPGMAVVLACVRDKARPYQIWFGASAASTSRIAARNALREAQMVSSITNAFTVNTEHWTQDIDAEMIQETLRADCKKNDICENPLLEKFEFGRPDRRIGIFDITPPAVALYNWHVARAHIAGRLDTNRVCREIENAGKFGFPLM